MPTEIQPLCPFFGVCGGCSSQNIAYGDQVEMKRAALPIAVDEVIPCPEPFYYRNRMDYPFGYQGELGLKAKGKWWKTLDLSTCFLLSKETPEILERVRQWSRATGLPFWNVKTHQGFFRYVVIREGKNTRERLVMLTVSDQASLSAIHRQSLVETLDTMATSIVLGVNPKITDLSIPETLEALKGTAYLHEMVNGITYRVQPGSFFQTNTIMAAKLQDTVLEFCGDVAKNKVMDLYCGAGFFSLALARTAENVMGVELDARAIEAARTNATLNHIDNATFIAAKVEDVDWQKEAPSVVVVDPPRSGLHPSVLATLTNALPERIVYVSCKIEQTVKELPALLEHYTIGAARALDLFPQTPHVEVVLQLNRL